MSTDGQITRAARGGLIVALLCLLAGCTTDASPPRPSVSGSADPPVVDRSIRSVDLGAVEWFDARTTSTVVLAGGTAKRVSDVAGPGGMTWQMLGPVAYADIDGDGDEDAAAGLHVVGGQLFDFAWYIWLWKDGHPVQLRFPIASVSRCEGPIESVTAEPQGFRVRILVFDYEKDTCAGGGSIPVTYVVAVRSGWPVRVAPEYGPVETCDPRQLTVSVNAPESVELRVAPDGQSPLVTESDQFDRLLVTELALSPYLTDDLRGDWVLVLAEQTLEKGTRRWCGWAKLPHPLR